MQDKPGYDNLDARINRLLYLGKMPVPTMDLSPEMVEYYKTPARVVFEMAERVALGPGDVFFDLGSGLGQVALLIHLLTGVAARGVEIEPAYCMYAQGCAAALGLSEVRFVAADARVADLSEGTVFYLFTPFRGEVFREVMERLRLMALEREIRVIGYGPCSEEVARLGWLKPDGERPRMEEQAPGAVYSLQFFSSR